MKYLPFALLFFLAFKSIAQDERLLNSDYVYQNNIKSVQLYVDGFLTSFPFLDINANTPLVLSFDDTDADAKNYVYTVVHCDINWQPSNLAEMEYIDGFVEDRIEDFQFSFKTLLPYTHYWLTLPNRNMSFTKSGNYLLKVYDNENGKKLVITRRFVIVEPGVQVGIQMVRPNAVSKMRTHQELDFVVDFQQLNIRSPQQEIRAVVLQNGRWDNAIYDIKPFFTRTTQLIFDYQDKIVFPAGKEFRYLDLRSLRIANEIISNIDQIGNTFDVTLFSDTKRFNQVFLNRRDINGQYIIESFDQQDSDLAGNYADVLFSLKSPEPYYDHDVYIFGELSDWKIDPRYKMAYNNVINGYVGKVSLKQGYYDYAYAVVPREGKDKTPDMGEIEGNWYETENQYTVLVYYRPFGERYDRVVGVSTINSIF